MNWWIIIIDYNYYQYTLTTSDKGGKTPMDQAAKERIMSSEDRNDSMSQSEAASELKTTLIPISIVAVHVYIQYIIHVSSP